MTLLHRTSFVASRADAIALIYSQGSKMMILLKIVNLYDIDTYRGSTGTDGSNSPMERCEMRRPIAAAEERGATEAGFVNATEAARALGVAVTTLYAYVGRKGIRTQRVPGSRQTRYWWPDIAQIRRKEKRAEGPQGPVGVTQETKITLMTQRGPYYRGKSALELAKTHSLEAVAAILWDVDEQTAFATRTVTVPKEFSTIQKMLRHASPVDVATALFPFIEHANPRSFDLSHQGMARTGVELLRWYACIHAGLSRPEAGPIHEAVAKALGANRDFTDLIRSMLVLSADHGFEAGTYAVRACATAGVTPYRSVLAGLAVVTGRRSNAGRSEAVMRLLGEIASEMQPERAIVRRLKDGTNVPGFGSSYYKSGDPRAQFLMKRFEEMFGDEKPFQKLKKAVATVKELCDLEPDLVFANAYGYSRLGMQSNQSLFPLGRAVGWIAHSIEQFETGEAARATESYTGVLPT
jgi:citrate synthase